MACCLDGSVLHLFRYLLTKLSLWLTMLGKIGMVSCVTLDTYSPTLFGHTKHESPSIFWVEISISQHQKTLILFELNMLLKIFEYLTSMKLLNFCICPYPSCHDSFTLKLI